MSRSERYLWLFTAVGLAVLLAHAGQWLLASFVLVGMVLAVATDWAERP